MRPGALAMCLIAIAATVVLAGPASAQTVYRCGPDGRSYSQQPCADGRPLQVGDARSESQRRDAETAAARDARTARSLERERLAVRAAAPTAAGIAGRGPAAAEPKETTPVAAKKKRRKPQPDDAAFSAAVPKPAKGKSKG